MERGKRRLSKELTDFIYSHVKNHVVFEGIDEIKFKYGLEMIILNISKGVVVFLLAILFDIFLEVIIVLVSYNLLRSKAYGYHAKTSLGCLISSVIFFIVGTLVVKNYYMPIVIGLLPFCIFFPIYYFYSPADTRKRPIIGQVIRDRLRLQSLLVLLALFMITVLNPYRAINTLIIYGAAIEAVLILPITYNLLKEEYNNYEKYED